MQRKVYSLWFLMPVAVIYGVFFLLPTILSFFFSTTVWNFTDFTFCGFDNFKTFFSEYSLLNSIRNTLVYAAVGCTFKVILGILLAVILTSKFKTGRLLQAIIYFPNLVSTLAIGLTFSALMHPTMGLFNVVLKYLGIQGPDWLGNVNIALLSVVFTNVWKALGVSTLICISGILSISTDYYEAASIDGAGSWYKFRHITLPLCRPAINTIIILASIDGMTRFDLIWAMTKGGPGFATDVLSSIIYKQYTMGYYGLSAAGYVVLFVLIAAIIFPLQRYLLKSEAEL